MFKFELGEKVKDNIVPFEGTIISRTEFISDTRKYCVTGIDTVGRPIEWIIDEDRLEKI